MIGEADLQKEMIVEVDLPANLATKHYPGYDKIQRLCRAIY